MPWWQIISWESLVVNLSVWNNTIWQKPCNQLSYFNCIHTQNAGGLKRKRVELKLEVWWLSRTFVIEAWLIFGPIRSYYIYYLLESSLHSNLTNFQLYVFTGRVSLITWMSKLLLTKLRNILHHKHSYSNFLLRWYLQSKKSTLFLPDTFQLLSVSIQPANLLTLMKLRYY